MELRHLRYFLAVAEARSFNAAAEVLHVAQPALSRQIRDLEDELDLLLFDRTSKGVTITPSGLLFAERAKAILAQVDLAIEDARRVNRGEIGTLVIAAAPQADWGYLTELLNRFEQQHPMARVKVQNLATQVQIEGIQQSRIDIGFVNMPADAPGLACEVVVQSPYQLLVPASRMNNPGNPACDLGSFLDLPFLIFPREISTGLFDRWSTLARRAGFRTTDQLGDQWQVATIVGLVASGRGVALAPEHALASYQQTGVGVVPVPADWPLGGMGMIRRKDDPNALVHALWRLGLQLRKAPGTSREG